MTSKRKGKDSLDMGASTESTTLTPEESAVSASEAFHIPIEDVKAATEQA